MNMKTFMVHVPQFNCEKFKDDFYGFIVKSATTVYDDKLYMMYAPSVIYDEIKNLNEEGIEIVK